MKELSVLYQAYGHAIELGVLADDGKEVLFQYSPQANAQGLELSPIHLPLRNSAYPDQQAQYRSLQGVPGLLYDSLPDSWGFHLLNRRLKARGIDPATVSTLDRLACLGENTMGALTYAPATEHLAGLQGLTLGELAVEVQALLVDDSHAVLSELARAGGSPGGARPKVLVDFHPETGQMSTQVGLIEGAEPWLVKFPASNDEADSCALEALYASVAHGCDLGMMPTRFFELHSGLCAFGTKRFDRDGRERVHVHTLAAMLHANFQIPSVGYADFFKLTRRLTRDRRELKKAVQRCVFNVLMHNRDDHAKNLAFLQDRDQTWHLAPPYDLTYCAGYQGEHFMDVAGVGKAPGRVHIVNAAAAAGMTEKESGLIIDEILDKVSDHALKVLSGELPVRSKTFKLVAKAIAENRQRLR